MLMQVDVDENARQILPTAPTAQDLTSWRIVPERHEAYAALWKYVTFGGIFANTALWLYFWTTIWEKLIATCLFK